MDCGKTTSFLFSQAHRVAPYVEHKQMWTIPGPPIYPGHSPMATTHAQLDLLLIKSLKSSTPPSHIRALFNEIVSSYLNRLLCITDESKCGNRVECAYSINNRIQNFRYTNTSTVFTAELQGIHHCLINLMNLSPSSHPQNFLFTSDSLTALFAIRNVNYINPQQQCNLHAGSGTQRHCWQWSCRQTGPSNSSPRTLVSPQTSSQPATTSHPSSTLSSTACGPNNGKASPQNRID